MNLQYNKQQSELKVNDLSEEIHNSKIKAFMISICSIKTKLCLIVSDKF